MANENNYNLRINVDADPSNIRRLGNEVQQLGNVGEQANKRIIEGQKEELGLLQRLEKQLKELKEARESANSETEIAQLNKQIKEAEQNLDRLNKIEPNKSFRDEINGLSDDLGDLPGPAGDAAGSIQGLTAAANPATIIVAALAAAIIATFQASKQSAFGLAENAKEIENLKNVTGVATLTAVTFAQAIKAQGGDVADITDIFNQLAGVVSEIKAGNKDLADAFKGFGIEDFSNLDTVVVQLAKNLSTLPKDINTVANASKILGEEGVRQFSAIAPEIDKYSKLVQELGLANEETLKKGKELNQAVAESAIAFEALQNTIGGETAPAFTEITKSVKDFILELAKSKTAKEFFKNFSEGLLEVVKLAVSTKNALKDLLDIIDPLVQKFTGFNNTLELISKNSLPGTVIEITRLINTYIAGDRALEQQIKKQKEYEEQLKQVTNTTVAGVKQQQDSIAAVKNQIEELSKTTSQLLENSKIASEQRIQELEEQLLNGAITERELLIETSEIKQNLANQEITLATETRDKINQLVQNGYDLKEELADAEIALNQTLLASDAQRIENIRALQNLTAKELREQIENDKKDRQNAIAQEIAEITDLENQKVILRQEAAQKKREILLREIEQQIEDEKSLIDNSEISQSAREDARKKLSDLISRQAEIDRQTEKSIQDAIVKDTQDAANKRIAEEKRISDEAKKEQDIRSALVEQQKAVDKSIFEQRIAGLKQAGATAEQIALATANFEIEQQQKIIALIKEKIAIQAKTSTDSAEIVKLNTQLIEAETRLNQLGNSRIELLNKQKAIINEINTAQASGNEQFAKALQQHIASVEKLGDRANSVAGNLKGGLTVIGESANLSSFSLDELQSKILELEDSIKFIREVAVIPDKDVFINSNLAVIEKLNEEIINRTQRVQLEAAAEEQRRKEEQARELAAELNKIAEEAAEERLEAEKERNKELKEIEKDRIEEIEDFNKREKENFEAFQEDKLEIVQDFDEREREIKDKALEDEKKRQKELIEAKEDAESNSLDKLNKLQRDAITERARIEAQLKDDTLDPQKREELEKKLKEITEESNEKITREQEKQAEIEKAIEESKSEEELKARLDAINKKFDLLEDEQKQREEIIKSGNAEELALFDTLIAEQKKRDEERLQKELERIEAQRLAKIEQAEKERKERQAELENRLKDLEDNYQKEKAEEEKRHQERLAELDKRQKEIRKKYKETLEDITESQNKATASLAENAGLAGDAFQSFFSTGVKEGEKFAELLDKINSKLGGIIDKTGNETTSNSTSSSSSSSSTSGNVLGSPNQGNNGGSAGSIDFNRVASGGNQGNQRQGNNNQQGQNNNNPSSPAASPSNNQPSSNQVNSSSNAPISAGSNQANQNSQVEPTQGSGQIDDSVPDLKTLDEFKAKLLKIQQNLFNATGLDVNKNYKKSEKDPIFANLKLLEQSSRVRYKVATKFINSYIPEIAGFATVNDYANIAAFATIVTREFEGEKGNRTFNYKKSVPEYTKDIDILLAGIERLRKANQPQEPSKFDDDLGTTVTPANPGTNPGDVNAPKSPNSPSGGRGNNPSPTSPNQTPKSTEPIGLSDKEKAFFAGRDLDATQGSFEGEGAERKGFVRSGPNFSGSNAPTAEEALLGKGSSDVIGASQTNASSANATVNQGLVLQPGSIQLNVQASSDQIVNAVKGLLLDVINNGQLTNAMKPQLDKQFQNNLLSRNPQNAIKLS